MSAIPTLSTPRLILRPFRLDDAPEVQRLVGDRAIADTTHVPHPYLDGMAEQWIDRHQACFAEGQGLALAITRKPDGALVGAISFMDMVKGHQAELGYWIGQAYWGQGYCTEAGRVLISYAFSQLGLVRIHASHFTRNPASDRVMQKLGFRHEGTRRQHIKKWDKLEDRELYGLLKDEWDAKI